VDAATPIKKFTTSIIDHYLIILANLFIGAASTTSGLKEDYVIIIL
jgi:hypothetical protein